MPPKVEVLPAGRSADRSQRFELKLARIHTREKRADQLIDVVKTLATNPIFVGAAALTVNELAYGAGLYNPGKNEKDETILGGPVWFQLGPGLPVAQQRRNTYRAWIMGLTTAMAMAPAANAGIKTIGEVMAMPK